MGPPRRVMRSRPMSQAHHRPLPRRHLSRMVPQPRRLPKLRRFAMFRQRAMCWRARANASRPSAAPQTARRALKHPNPPTSPQGAHLTQAARAKRMRRLARKRLAPSPRVRHHRKTTINRMWPPNRGRARHRQRLQPPHKRLLQLLSLSRHSRPHWIARTSNAKRQTQPSPANSRRLPSSHQNLGRLRVLHARLRRPHHRTSQVALARIAVLPIGHHLHHRQEQARRRRSNGVRDGRIGQSTRMAAQSLRTQPASQHRLIAPQPCGNPAEQARCPLIRVSCAPKKDAPDQRGRHRTALGSHVIRPLTATRPAPHVRSPSRVLIRSMHRHSALTQPLRRPCPTSRRSTPERWLSRSRPACVSASR